MHTIINALPPVTRARPAEATSPDVFRKPNYECQETPDALRLVVFVPGVDANGVDIEARGPDLIISARKSHFVRVNWQSLHLETVQRDYLLRLRLGSHLDHAAMQAEIHEGVLTVTLPKHAALAAGAVARLQRVA